MILYEFKFRDKKSPKDFFKSVDDSNYSDFKKIFFLCYDTLQVDESEYYLISSFDYQGKYDPKYTVILTRDKKDLDEDIDTFSFQKSRNIMLIGDVSEMYSYTELSQINFSSEHTKNIIYFDRKCNGARPLLLFIDFKSIDIDKIKNDLDKIAEIAKKECTMSSYIELNKTLNSMKEKNAKFLFYGEGTFINSIDPDLITIDKFNDILTVQKYEL